MKCPSCGSNMKNEDGRIVCKYCGYEQLETNEKRNGNEDLFDFAKPLIKQWKYNEEEDEHVTTKYEIIELVVVAIIIIACFVSALIMLNIIKS